MKVLHSSSESRMEPVSGSVAHAGGVPLPQNPFPWLGNPDAAAALQTLTALEAWHLQAQKAAAGPLLSDVEQIRMKISSLSAQCSQMQQRLSPKADYLAHSYARGPDMFPVIEQLSIAELAALSEYNSNPMAKMMFHSLAGETLSLSSEHIGA